MVQYGKTREILNHGDTDAVIGNGIREEGEAKISGILVELYEVVTNENSEAELKPVEIWKDGWIDAYTVTGEDGKYTFEGFIPGDYIVRFVYGDEDEEHKYNGKVVNYEGNAKYNGQDYKSTTYQVGITQEGKTDADFNDYSGTGGYSSYTDTTKQNRTNTDNSYTLVDEYNYGYDIYKADTAEEDYSDAKDIWGDRLNVNNFSSGKDIDGDGKGDGVTYELANELDKLRTGEANDDTKNGTRMRAETGVIVAEVEYNRINSGEDNNTYNDDYYKNLGYENGIDYANGNDKNGIYKIENVDFGLEERPKAQLELNKQVSNVKVVLANQTVLFDATQTADNLIWQLKTPYNINEMKEEEDKTTKQLDTDEENEVMENIYRDYYGQYDNFRNAVMERINTLVTGKKGIIQATMDEELMHGTTIQITYDLKVTNIGEVDYNETQFYYTGKVSNKNNIVTTSADLVLDYVANNLQFRKDSNKEDWGWETITNQTIKDNKYVSNVKDEVTGKSVEDELKDFNTIIKTEALGKDKLIPVPSEIAKEDDKGEKAELEKAYAEKVENAESKPYYSEIKLVLTQLITSQNKDDDLSYGNIAEIVKISNDVGRRMAFSIQGNQSPSGEPKEPDASRAEEVIILPPFGEVYLYLGLAILVAVLLGVSIIVIKKTVLNKKMF